MSNTDSISFYQSVKVPSLQTPVQIRIDFPEAQGIAGIKFKASSPSNGPFIGTMSMFGINDDNPSYINVRNSDNWDRLIDRKILTNPWNNENDSWTDWYATNCFTGEQDEYNKPIYNRYKHYVIEF